MKITFQEEKSHTKSGYILQIEFFVDVFPAIPEVGNIEIKGFRVAERSTDGVTYLGT